MTLSARSLTTGVVVQQTIDPIPTAASLWATSTSPTALDLTGSGFTANGRVHSEGGIRIQGSGTTLSGGVEYTGDIKASNGPSIRPAATKVVGGQGAPVTPQIADYRPGGSKAGPPSGYRAIDPSKCVNGSWSPGPKDGLTGVVYVPCNVLISGSGTTIRATIVAEGTIQVTSSGALIGRDDASTPSLVSGATGLEAIKITASGVTLKGTVFAPQGGVNISGSGTELRCGILANTITISSSGASTPITARCIV
jgi:Haemagluttinin repeat